MLLVVLQWFYLGTLAYGLGFMFSEFCERVLKYRMKTACASLLTGIIILTVYAQIFSLFHKVGLAANIVIVLLTLAYLLLRRRQFAEYFMEQWKGCSILCKIVVVFLFFLWAYFTSRGYMTYDTALYHGQSIRWIEEYGVVKGLGNLHERFAYNSSIFSLYALLSMRYLTGGISLHTANGFLALVVSMSALKLGNAWKRKKLNLSDYARIALIYYLTTICDEIIAPASDYPVMCMIFFIIITWLEVLEQQKEKEASIVPYCLLCVAGVYTLTLKLTAGLILLLLIKPAAYLLKHKKWKEIGIYLLLGLLVAIPWIARYVIISGWLIYPLTAIDLFNVDWKMPAQILESDANYIHAWGRALYNMYAMDVPITEWFPNWFETTLLSTEKLLILADFVSLAVVAGAVIITFIKKRWENLDAVLVLATVACSYIYWQTSAPLMRYGYAHVLLLIVLAFGWVASFITLKMIDRAIRTLVLLLGAYKAIWIWQYTMDCSEQPYYIWQQDYEAFELRENYLEGQLIYTPIYGDRTGYYSFPAAPDLELVELRGDSLEEGFRTRDY